MFGFSITPWGKSLPGIAAAPSGIAAVSAGCGINTRDGDGSSDNPRKRTHRPIMFSSAGAILIQAPAHAGSYDFVDGDPLPVVVPDIPVEHDDSAMMDDSAVEEDSIIEDESSESAIPEWLAESFGYLTAFVVIAAAGNAAGGDAAGGNAAGGNAAGGNAAGGNAAGGNAAGGNATTRSAVILTTGGNSNLPIDAKIWFADLDGTIADIETMSGLTGTGLDFDAESHVFTGPFTGTSDATVFIRATYNDGGTADHALDITANAAPTAANAIADRMETIDEDIGSIDLSDLFIDPDGDTLSLEVTYSRGDTGLMFNKETDRITGVLTGIGDVNVTVTADDGRGGTASHDFDIAANALPRVGDAIADRTETVGVEIESIELGRLFEDPDGDVLDLEVEFGDSRSGLIFQEETMRISGILTRAGSVTVTVSAGDPHGGSAMYDFDVIGVPPGENHPPTVTPAALETVVLTTGGANAGLLPIDVNTWFVDRDDTVLMHSLSDSTALEGAGLTWSAGNGLITGQFTGTVDTRHTLRAADDDGAFAEHEFTIVANEAPAPRSDAPVEINTVSGTDINLPIDLSGWFDDADGDALTYAATVNAGPLADAGIGLTLSDHRITGRFTGAANAMIGITADDGRGGISVPHVFNIRTIPDLEGTSGDDDLRDDVADWNRAIRGFAGDDAIDGGAGEDTVVYEGSYGDFVFEAAVDADGGAEITIEDTVGAGDADEGRDTLENIEKVRFNMDEFDIVSGTAELNNIQGGSRNEIILGLDGGTGGGASREERINGGLGHDIILGGDGVDYIRGDGIYSPTGTARNDSDVLYGFGGNDTLHGDNGDDAIHGGEGDDTIYAGDGDDAIWGGPGRDTIDGGRGGDSANYSGDFDADEIRFIRDDNEVTVGRGNEMDTLRNIERLNFRNTTMFITEWNRLDDVLTDRSDVAYLISVPANYQYAGNQFLEFGGSRNIDVINGGAGRDRIDGRSGNDIIRGGPGDDYIEGGWGVNIIHGDGGDDVLRGSRDMDTIHGGDDDDDIYGFAGNDILNGGGGDDTIRGGQHNDTIRGLWGSDDIHGGSGSDTIYGGTSHDEIFGGAGNDTIYGESGNDKIDGGAGNDTVDGGSGEDTVIYGRSVIEWVFGINGRTISVEEAERFGTDYRDEFVNVEKIEISGREYRIGRNQLNGNNQDGGNDNDLIFDVENGDNEIDGGPGQDIFIDGNGDDRYEGRAGHDVFFDGAGTDEYYGADGQDSVVFPLRSLDYSILTSTTFNIHKNSMIRNDLTEEIEATVHVTVDFIYFSDGYVKNIIGELDNLMRYPAQSEAENDAPGFSAATGAFRKSEIAVFSAGDDSPHDAGAASNGAVNGAHGDACECGSDCVQFRTMDEPFECLF